VIPALGSLRQEGSEFWTSLDYIVRPCLKKRRGPQWGQVFWAVRSVTHRFSTHSMSRMISGSHNPLGTPGTSPSQNDLASLIQA
jgi:hypothetical protein